MKKIISIILAVLMVGTAVYATDTAEPPAPQEAEYILFNLCDETIAGETITALESYADVAAPTVRGAANGGYGIQMRCYKSKGYAPEPRITFGTKVAADKYPFVKLCISYERASSTISNNLPMTSYIQFGGAVKTKIAELAADGQTLTDVSGNEYAFDDYKSTPAQTNFISIVTELDRTSAENSGESVSGDVSVTYCPAMSDETDYQNINSVSVLKYMVFCKTKEAAENFDISLKSASYTHDEVVYDATIDTIAHTATIDLPNGLVDETTFNAENVAVQIADSRCVATPADYTGEADFGVDYAVTNLEGDTVNWKLNINCMQLNDTYIAAMIDALNKLTEENKAEFLATYEWILNVKSEDYKNLEDEFKPGFFAGLEASAGTFTAENYEQIIKDEAFYSKVKSGGSADAFVLILKDSIYAENNSFKTFGDKLDTTQKETVYTEAVKETTFNAFSAAINEKSVVTAINSQVSYGEVQEIFESNLEFLGYTEEEYDELCSNTDSLEKVYMKLLDCGFEKSSEISAAFETAIDEVGEEAEDDEPSYSGGGGFSGGGGGGGGGISFSSVALPSINAEPQNVPAEVAPEEVPEEAPSEETPTVFGDLENAAWAKASIENLYAKGIINGKAENVFAPYDNVKREEFVKMIVVAFGIEAGEAEVAFDDVPKTAWYHEYVTAAVNAGIITGVDESKFGTETNISRQDMAVIADRVLKKLYGEYNTAEATEFADGEETAAYAKDAVSALAANGVITGDNGNFMPKDNATRAQCAVVIDRLITLAQTLQKG